MARQERLIMTNIEDMGSIDQAQAIADEAREAFEEWLKLHTLDNRSMREMFYFGYYEAKTRANLQYRSDVQA